MERSWSTPSRPSERRLGVALELVEQPRQPRIGPIATMHLGDETMLAEPGDRSLGDSDLAKTLRQDLRPRDQRREDANADAVQRKRLHRFERGEGDRRASTNRGGGDVVEDAVAGVVVR